MWTHGMTSSYDKHNLFEIIQRYGHTEDSVALCWEYRDHSGKIMGLIRVYSIHVPGWLLKWLNLITAPGSVSNEPGSVTWLATKYLKTVSWRNHTEKITPLCPQITSFWPKINIPSSYFTISMLNCLEILWNSCVTAMWQLSNSWPN